ncbi:pali-domain-containing protein [Mycena polygramma]|nr:pali-domain-containing protein [Mycena polygramma]
MSARSLHIAGTAFLGVALILSLATSISLPYLPALDFVRVNFPNAPKSADIMSQLRFGIWAPCFYDGNGKRSCPFGGHGYSFLIGSFDLKQSVLIGSSWTRGLAIHPVATAFTGLALGFACSKHEHGPILATLSSFIAAFLMLLAFIVDIALFAFVKQQVGTLPNGNTSTSSAFWMTFVSLILVLLAGCTVFFGRRREAGVGSSYPSFSSSNGGILSRFRKS